MSVLQVIVSLAMWAGGWLVIGILIGRHVRARTLDRLIDTAVALARAGVEEDTPLHRAQSVKMPDRTGPGWDQS